MTCEHPGWAKRLVAQQGWWRDRPRQRLVATTGGRQKATAEGEKLEWSAK
jgi:hypothetical protein